MNVNDQQLSFRAASVADVAALTALEASYYPTDGYPAPLFFQAHHQWSELLQLACCGEQVVGYCMGAPGLQPQSLWLMSMLISAEHRGQGIGAKLLRHWLAKVDQLGYQTTQLSVAPDNTNAIRLYQQLGFRSGAQKHDYLGPGEHRLLMQRQALTSD
ncbi:GNAT family N-acetyltransferase [Pseudidiomarina halophila]|uniref:GNAT family N-acetyltransferase n=1 Tax=Pseudidiomarina halophila TaxID=1449799 RepID=UPI001300602A|nr:N-acetyltransferase [Pseudidiomarina halophila]